MTPPKKMCLLQKFVHSTIACSVSRTAELCAMLCASRSLRSPTPPQTTAITCQYAFVCRLRTVCVRSIYRLYAVSMLIGHLLAGWCSLQVGCCRVACVARLARSAMGCSKACSKACAVNRYSIWDSLTQSSMHSIGNMYL